MVNIGACHASVESSILSGTAKLCSRRLEAQDIALSRQVHRFESGRERQVFGRAGRAVEGIRLLSGHGSKQSI